jgi:RNA polymerase sigma factor (sigma-70 family)
MALSSFPTTRRSVVMALGSDDPAERAGAFDVLVACYWRPLFKYARVAWRKSREESEDLSQSFFVRVLENDSLARHDPSKAGFRTFLRLLFERHITDDYRASQRLKRGGAEQHLDFDTAELEVGSEGSTPLTPEEYFQQEWARSVFTVAVERLRESSLREGREMHFQLFELYDLADDRTVSYAQLAQHFDLTETQVTNWLAATRKRFRETVLATLRELTASESEFRAEARALLGIE